MRSMRALGAVGFVMLMVGCSKDSGSGPTANEQDPAVDLAVASVAGEGAARDVEFMNGPTGRFGFGFRFNPRLLDCEGGERDGLAVTRTCVFKDAAGTVQAVFDPLTTATVSVHVTVKGSFDRGHFSATVDNSRDFTASGLAGEETQRTWNGVGTGATTRVREREDATVTFDMQHADTVTDVVIPVGDHEHPWPLSGTIVQHFTVTITGGEHDGAVRKRDVTIAFDGTQFASVTVNGESFQVDMANRDRPKKRNR